MMEGFRGIGEGVSMSRREQFAKALTCAFAVGAFLDGLLEKGFQPGVERNRAVEQEI
jgi:hypothetical protein